MTNEYKLAPSVPTDGMCIEGNETIASLLEVGELAGVDDVYNAMLKDAPTLVEVDLEDMKKDISNKVSMHDSIKNNGYNQALEDLKQKHGKLYAKK